MIILVWARLELRINRKGKSFENNEVSEPLGRWGRLFKISPEGN